MQENGVIVLGLTARVRREVPYTHPPLLKVGIAFDSRYPDQEISLDDHHSVLLEKGILFCDKYKKGDVLIAFLKQVNLSPQRILFVDDKLSHVQDLEEILESSNIDYVGFRFSKADKRVQEYDSRIADIQLEFFPTFISDEEAALIIEKPSK